MSRKMKRRLKDLQGLAKLNAGVHYPPDQDRAQLRGGKRSFARVLTSTNDSTKPSEGGQD